jgi:hypothetical protein
MVDLEEGVKQGEIYYTEITLTKSNEPSQCLTPIPGQLIPVPIASIRRYGERQQHGRTVEILEKKTEG